MPDDTELPEALSEDRALSVYLGYGWVSPERDVEISNEDYKPLALGIAEEVRECLANEGFAVTWSGDLSQKIRLPFVWQRRTMLV